MPGSAECKWGRGEFAERRGAKNGKPGEQNKTCGLQGQRREREKVYREQTKSVTFDLELWPVTSWQGQGLVNDNKRDWCDVPVRTEDKLRIDEDGNSAQESVRTTASASFPRDTTELRQDSASSCVLLRTAHFEFTPTRSARSDPNKYIRRKPLSSFGFKIRNDLLWTHKCGEKKNKKKTDHIF